MLPKQKFFSQTNPHVSKVYATTQSRGSYFKLGLPVGTLVCARPINKRQPVTVCVKKNAKNVEGEMSRCSECQNREKRMVWFEICSLRNENL